MTAPRAAGDSRPVPQIRVSLAIENHYPGGSTVHTQATDVLVAALPADIDEVGLHEWALDQLFPFTGTGRAYGDSWYDVSVTASSDPRLRGREFAFGY